MSVPRLPLAVLLLLSAGAARAQNADQPWQQKEPAWVDDRWSHTDLGGFLSANLPLPGGTVKKGLAIRLGEPGSAALGYDTAA